MILVSYVDFFFIAEWKAWYAVKALFFLLRPSTKKRISGAEAMPNLCRIVPVSIKLTNCDVPSGVGLDLAPSLVIIPITPYVHIVNISRAPGISCNSAHMGNYQETTMRRLKGTPTR